MARWPVLARNGIIAALLVEIVVFSLLSDRFLTVSNLRLVLLQTAAILIVAVPSAILLFSGYVDFAVGSILGLCAVVLGRLLAGGMTVWWAAPLIVVLALIIGLSQGIMVTRLGFPTFVVTLGFFTAIRGLAFVINDGRISNRFGNTFAVIGRGRVRFLEIPVPIAIGLVTVILGALFLYKTRWGRYVMAIGINPVAAFRSGIKIHRLPVVLYAATAVAASIGALITVSRLDSAPPTLGEGLELNVLSAVLLGGVAFSGGRGNLLGVFAGVLFIGILNDGLLLFGVAPFWFRVSSGLALVVAAALDAITRRVEAKRGGTL
jgi:ribose/xylose/arabinose/galactoside ABC-type transport system permease subunit